MENFADPPHIFLFLRGPPPRTYENSSFSPDPPPPHFIFFANAPHTFLFFVSSPPPRISNGIALSQMLPKRGRWKVSQVDYPLTNIRLMISVVNVMSETGQLYDTSVIISVTQSSPEMWVCGPDYVTEILIEMFHIKWSLMLGKIRTKPYF